MSFKSLNNRLYAKLLKRFSVCLNIRIRSGLTEKGARMKILGEIIRISLSELSV